MEGVSYLLQDLGLILIAAAVVTLIFKKLKQPLVLGYIVAGFIVSPHMPYTQSVLDIENIEALGNIGVVFLLFALGLEFSFKKIAKMGVAPIIAALLIVICMMVLGNSVGHMFGWGDMDCVFLGGMLAMSSTTIIYKAFDDMGLRQQKFTSLVMSVLILEDILAIVLMVMLSSFAQGGGLDSGQMMFSILRIIFYVLIWFILGIFLIPLFLRKTKRLMGEETLMIVSLALCFLMALVSVQVGFSSAFGAFIMGSILAETLEVEKIEKVVEPVKNLFGAVFFVSVGMLVDPKILVEYAVPIICLVLTILIGHAVFSSTAYFISGQQLKSAMRCGFSMAQIGEFAFIIASLGLELKVISAHIYPVVVAVSVITTFLTPYMIKLSTPAYDQIEKMLPKKWMDVLNNLTASDPDRPTKQSKWKSYINNVILQVVIYTVVCVGILLLMATLVGPLIMSLIPGGWGTLVSTVVTLILMAPFLRAIAMKHLRTDTFIELWNEHQLNRLPLITMVIIRNLIAMFLVFKVIDHFSDKFGVGMLLAFAFMILVIIVSSRGLKKRGMTIEKLFLKNLNAREEMAAGADKISQFEDKRLIDRDIHIAEIVIPEDSEFSGQSLHDLHFGTVYGIHIGCIIRGSYRINIPRGHNCLYPGDVLRVTGTDEQLTNFNKAIRTKILPEGIKQPEMKVLRIQLTEHCPFVGKTIAESGIRDEYNCMALGIDQGGENLTPTNGFRKFQVGDILWLVGEQDKLDRISMENNPPE